MFRDVDLARVKLLVLLCGLLLMKVVLYFFEREHSSEALGLIHFNYNKDDKH